MKILFLHPNFPGQFKNIAAAAAKSGHDVYFLCQTHYGRELKSVKRLTLKGDLGNIHLDKMKISALKRNQLLAKQYRNGFLTLKKNNWIPDLVISHSGWGCGTYVKEIWPDTKLISYLEWWFNPKSTFFTYDISNKDLNINQDSITKQWERNQTIALELATSQAIVCPTKWQKQQLPKIYQNHCDVIFDGIDTKKFNKNLRDDKKQRKVLTYGTRGMDPIRAFPQFIKALPNLLDNDRNLVVEIAGIDDTFYGTHNKSEKTSWGKWAKKYLDEKNLGAKVKWVGHLGAGKYEKWLANSSCHVYLTHPFIASWSFVEALACGIPLIASNVEPVKEFCVNDSGIELVDHRCDNFLTEPVLRVLQQRCPIIYDRKIVLNLSVEKSLDAWSRVAGIELHTVD